MELKFALWSWAANARGERRRFGVRLAVRTMGTYLASWECTAEKPLRRAYELDPAAGGAGFGTIAASRALQGGARTIDWGARPACDPSVRGRSYAPRGRTPEVRVNHKRAGLGLIAAVTTRASCAGWSWTAR